jgi:hypothetical protein
MTGLSFLKGTRALVKSFIARVTSDGGIIEAAKCIGDLDADLAMQPSGYKATKLYSEKPSTGVGDFTVDRNSTATRVNSLGFIESVAANVPRLDYTDGNCPSLLLEPQGTNYWTNSEGSSIVLNSPLGEFGFYTLNNNSQTRSISYVGDITFTFIVKKINGTVPTITANSGSGDLVVLVNGGSAAGLGGVLTNIGNGFYKYKLTISSNGSSVARVQNSSGIDTYVSLIQYEDGTSATSYIPTSGSTVTRLADVVGGAGDVNTINSTEGVLYAEISAFDNSNDTFGISLNDGSSNNRIFLSLLTPSSVYRGFSTGGGNITFTGLDVTSTSKVAVRYSLNNFSLWVKGVKRGEDLVYAGISANTLNNLSFDRNGFGEFNFYGRVKDLEYYKTALTDERLIYITGTLNENYYNTYFDMSNALNYTAQ